MTDLYDHVNTRLRGLQRDYQSRLPSALGTMAALRSSVSKPPGTNPEIWELTLEGLDRYTGQDSEASTAEWASHIALCSYAVHQQSLSEPMHVPGQNFGGAVRRLMDSGSYSEAGVRRQMNALVTASSGREFQHHLGALVRMMKAARIGFDYARLAQQIDLYLTPAFKHSVQLRWAREFTPVRKAASTDTTPTSEEN